MIPFIDLNRDKEEIIRIKSTISEVIDSGKFILGKQVEDFEKQFSEFTRIKHVIGVGSGTDALAMILKVIGAKKVGVCASAPLPCAQAIIMSGAIPVFFDTYANTGLINIHKMKNNLDGIDTLLAVHLYGMPEKIQDLSNVCKQNNIKLVEDCAQSVGTFVDDKHTGNFSIASGFSFYPTKNLGCFGDGGIIATNNSELAKQFKNMRNYGQNTIYSGQGFGINSRLDEMQAAILSVKIEKLIQKNEKRKKIAEKYKNGINNKLIDLPNKKYFEMSNMHIFPIFTKYRNQLKEFLFKNGITTTIHYPIPINKQKAFNDFSVDCIEAEKMAEQELSLPIFSELNSDEIEKIIETLNGFVL